MPKGSCWCRAITYEYTGSASMKIVCHCISCQKISGTAFTTNLFVPKSALTITSSSSSSPPSSSPSSSSSQPKKYIQPHETGLPITIYFCGNCATTLWKHGGSEKFEDYWVVQAGTLDAEEEGEGEGEDEGKGMGGKGKGGKGRKAIDVEVPEEEYWTDCRAGWLGALGGMKQHGGFA